MKPANFVVALSMLVASCAAHEESSSKVPASSSLEPIATTPSVMDAAPSTAAQSRAVASIASVELNQDCPDERSDEAATGGALRSRRSQTNAGFAAMPCSQSFVQFAFVGEEPGSINVELKELRLLSATGKRLATLQARMPTIWQGEVYVPWDGVLSAGPDQKVSYKLSLPDWASVEKELGDSSYGQMYVLEVDVEMAGSATTLRSPQFERKMAEVIRT